MGHPECPETAICVCRDNARRALLDELYEAINGEQPPAMAMPPVQLWEGLLALVRLHGEYARALTEDERRAALAIVRRYRREPASDDLLVKAQRYKAALERLWGLESIADPYFAGMVRGITSRALDRPLGYETGLEEQLS